MAVSDLITEMLEVKAEHPTLERSEILRIFNIQAMKDLTNEIRKARIN